MKRIFPLFFLIPFFGLAQNKVSIAITGVKNSDGKISIAAYHDPEGFLKIETVFASETTAAVKGITKLTMDLPNGKYALAVFHDENGNGKLDTNWLGIPKEKVAFSNAKMKTFGPPGFKECSFVLDEDKKLTIAID